MPSLLPLLPSDSKPEMKSMTSSTKLTPLEMVKYNQRNSRKLSLNTPMLKVSRSPEPTRDGSEGLLEGLILMDQSLLTKLNSETSPMSLPRTTVLVMPNFKE